MSYTIQQVATWSRVSVRTLHYYDEIGLLKPLRQKKNDYRYYTTTELLRLQQILFFRELEFPLTEIKRILNARGFDMRSALKDQQHLLGLKRKRLNRLITSITVTLKKLNQPTSMTTTQLYDSFNNEEIDQYAEEAKKRWGHTKAYKQSQERLKKMTATDITKLKKDQDEFMKNLAATMVQGATSPEFQKLIDQHYQSLRTFYEPSLELYRGLAAMYIEDPRFTATYEKYAPGLAQIMHDAMIAYCNSKERA